MVANSSEQLYRAVLSYAVFGLVVRDQVVVRVAPIASWMRGRPLAAVRRWIQKKAGTLELVK